MGSTLRPLAAIREIPAQAEPATEWEARIASLMDVVVRAPSNDERLRAFHEVQRIFLAELPAIYFAAPRVVVATSARLSGATPVVLAPHILWNPEALGVTR